MLLALAAFCIYAGFGAIAFSMPKHYLRATGSQIQAKERILLRAVGELLLACALIATIVRDGVSFGVLLSIAVAGVLGIAHVLLLAWRPRLAFACSPAAWLTDSRCRSDAPISR